MKPAENSWPATVSSRGVLFIAQAVRTIISTESFESFRIMSLDTPARLSEAQSLLDDLIVGRLPKAAFEPVRKELIWSLENDPSIDHQKQDQVSALVTSLRAVQSPEKLDVISTKHHVQMVFKKISEGYKTRLEDIIVANYNDVEKRDEVLSALSAYCSHLINIGYSKEWILEVATKKFFTEDVLKAGARNIRRFFGAFDGLDNRYRVYVSVARPFATYVLGLIGAKVLDFGQLPAFIQTHISGTNWLVPKNRYLFFTVKSKDPFGAARSVGQELASMKSMTFLGNRSFDCEWNGDFLVCPLIANSIRHVMQKDVELIRAVGKVLAGHTARRVRDQSKAILENFDDLSTERITSALNTAHLALVSPSPENRLISLWSAVEVLLSEPQAGTPRIVHYSRLVVPCINVRHPRRFVVAVYNGLLTNHRLALVDFINTLGYASGLDKVTAFAAGAILDEHEAKRAVFLAKLASNPLAQHRVLEVRKKWGTPSAFFDSWEMHDKKLDWQTNRIYRARNQLVHAGRVPPYLDLLILNAFEYFRNALGPIVGQSSVEHEKTNVDQVVAELGIYYRAQNNLLTSLKKKKEFDFETLRRAFNHRYAD